MPANPAKPANLTKPAGSASNLTSQFLIAMPGMTDGNFAGSVVLLCEHTERGALGLVINKPSDIKLGKLFEKVDLSLDRDELAEQPVYIGGPVQTERGFVLHERGDDDEADPDADGARYSSSLRIPGGLAMTTSRDVLEALANGAGPKRVLVTLGYAGWGAGQLEDEVARNGWITVDAQPEVIFETPIEQRYERALGLLGISQAMLSAQAGHA
jgi:putative transcriptional regulator